MYSILVMRVTTNDESLAAGAGQPQTGKTPAHQSVDFVVLRIIVQRNQGWDSRTRDGATPFCPRTLSVSLIILMPGVRGGTGP